MNEPISTFDASIDLALLAADLDGTIVFRNEHARRLFGLATGDGLDWGNLASLFGPSGTRGGELRECLDAAHREGKWAGTLEHAGSDGRTRATSVVIRPSHDARGLVHGYLVSAREIARDARAATLARPAMPACAMHPRCSMSGSGRMGRRCCPDGRYREVVDAASNPIIVVDRDGRIVLVNTPAETLFGHDRGELVGQLVEILVPIASRCKHAAARKRYLDSPMTHSMGSGHTLLGRRKNGSEFPVEIGLQPIETDDGPLVIASIVDTTDRLRNEALARRARELAQSNEELERFAYVASHDLQEPLRTVSGFARLLARRYEGRLDASADEYIGFIIDGVTRMQSLINDLLEYSRVTGKHAAAFREVDCERILDRVLADLKAAIDAASARITRDPLPTLWVDSTQLGQVFQNLIGNALKFHGEADPAIHVGAERRDESWLFSVRDNGIGFEPRHLDRVFTIFQRLHTRDRYPGTGIGLAICKRIVERHGGRIWAESAPGQGACFYFSIPARVTGNP